MEEKKFHDIFTGYDPEMSSGKLFVDNVKMRMEAVEIVRLHNARQMRRCRLAVIVASVVGFLAGTLFSLIIPALTDFMSDLITRLAPYVNSIHLASPSSDLSVATTLAWIVAAGLTILTTLTAYTLTSSYKARTV